MNISKTFTEVKQCSTFKHYLITNNCTNLHTHMENYKIIIKFHEAINNSKPKEINHFTLSQNNQQSLIKMLSDTFLYQNINQEYNISLVQMDYIVLTKKHQSNNKHINNPCQDNNRYNKSTLSKFSLNLTQMIISYLNDTDKLTFSQTNTSIHQKIIINTVKKMKRKARKNLNELKLYGQKINNCPMQPIIIENDSNNTHLNHRKSLQNRTETKSQYHYGLETLIEYKKATTGLKSETTLLHDMLLETQRLLTNDETHPDQLLQLKKEQSQIMQIIANLIELQDLNEIDYYYYCQKNNWVQNMMDAYNNPYMPMNWSAFH